MKQSGLSIFSGFVWLLLPWFVYGQDVQHNIDSLIIALEVTASPEKKVEVLLELSSASMQSSPEKALKFATTAHKLSKGEDNPDQLWHACVAVSNAYQEMDSINKSNRMALEALQISREADDTKKIAQSLRRLGGRMINAGSFSLAGEYLYESLDLYEQLHDSVNISTIYILLGIINYHLDNSQKALEYYRLGLDLSLKTKNQVNISASLNNLAAVYEMLEDYDQAMNYFEQALEINKESNNVGWMANNYLNIGIVKFKQHKYEESFPLLYKAESFYDSLENLSGVVNAWAYLAKSYYAQGFVDSAYRFARKSLDLSHQIGDLKTIILNCETLVDYFQGIERSDSVAYYKILNYETQDSLKEEEYLLDLSKLEQQYSFQKQQQIIALAQQRKDFVKVLFISGLAVLLLIIILLYSRLRIKIRHNRLQKHHIERELEFKNQELTANVVNLMKRNETLSDLQIRLKTIERTASKSEVKEAIRKIAIEIGKMTDKEILSEFEMRFKEVHRDFYDKLIKTYPDLWPSELKLCAFLRLNMTTKEISQLTGQTQASIEKARYRLRRKLNLPGSDVNLVSFLTAF